MFLYGATYGSAKVAEVERVEEEEVAHPAICLINFHSANDFRNNRWQNFR
jgi:hypothetical protein